MPSERVKLAMVCVCQEPGQAKAATDRDRCIELAGFGRPEELMTGLVSSLWWTFEAGPVEILYDQWAGVSVQKTVDDVVTTYYCECDRVEDGLVRIWLHLHDEVVTKKS